MRLIGYACINRTKGLSTNHTLRLANFSYDRWVDKIVYNFNNLYYLLEDCIPHKIFRIGSGLIPFATHQITSNYDWRVIFKPHFDYLAKYIKYHNIRITMHPDQFVVLNSPDENIYKNAVKELEYHADLMELLGLDSTNKMQIHTGGVYNDKKNSISRFIKRYEMLSSKVKRYLVLENDDVSYSLSDVIHIHIYTGIPILFDTLHHECLNNFETHYSAFQAAASTWKQQDGIPLIDYSSQEPNSKKGRHAESIDINHFRYMTSLLDTVTKNYDIILEIKDKEISLAKVIS